MYTLRCKYTNCIRNTQDTIQNKMHCIRLPDYHPRLDRNRFADIRLPDVPLYHARCASSPPSTYSVGKGSWVVDRMKRKYPSLLSERLADGRLLCNTAFHMVTTIQCLCDTPTWREMNSLLGINRVKGNILRACACLTPFYEEDYVLPVYPPTLFDDYPIHGPMGVYVSLLAEFVFPFHMRICVPTCPCRNENGKCNTIACVLAMLQTHSQKDINVAFTAEQARMYGGQWWRKGIRETLQALSDLHNTPGDQFAEC